MKKLNIILLMLIAGVTIACASQPVKKVKQQPADNATDSIAAIKERAEKGDAVAQNTVGTWYYAGKHDLKQDYDKALQMWARSAKQGNADAIGNMAMCYQLGRGTDRDSAMAVTLYEKAIQKGNASIIPQHEQIVKNTGSLFSALLLRECYQKGIGVKRDMQKASDYLKIAAEQGHTDSEYAYALSLLNNNQADKAVEWFKRCAKTGHTGATYYYGNLMHKGIGITQDKEKGILLLRAAADKQFTMAEYQLGKIYYEGDGADKDFDKAFTYLKRAAEKNNAGAEWMISQCYLKGEGTPQDYYFATQWMAEVAMTTHKKEIAQLLTDDNEGAFSQYLMGLRKYYIEKDYASAIDYFKKVEKAKHVEGTIMQAVCLANKDYEKRNLKKAVKMLAKQSQTSALASYYLSSLYETGTGVEKDDSKAVELLEKASDAGIAYAQCKLADRYMTGKGVTQDFTKAARLYLMAEAQKHLTPQSAKNLAECYKKKVAALPDLSDAEARIAKLEKQGNNNNLINMLRALEK